MKNNNIDTLTAQLEAIGLLAECKVEDQAFSEAYKLFDLYHEVKAACLDFKKAKRLYDVALSSLEEEIERRIDETVFLYSSFLPNEGWKPFAREDDARRRGGIVREDRFPLWELIQMLQEEEAQ